MTTTVLRKAGGSAILTLPPFALGQIGARIGDTLNVSVKGDAVILRRVETDKKALFAQLIAEQAEVQEELDKDRDWVTKRRPVGNEVL